MYAVVEIVSRTTVALTQSVVWSVQEFENKIFPGMSRSLSIKRVDHCDDTLKMLLLFSKAGGDLNKILKKSLISIHMQPSVYHDD